jgi:hypothetical protein
MRRASALVLSLLLGLALLADGAAAKELEAVKGCGAHACRNLDRAKFPAFEEGGEPVDPPKSAPGWYRARLTVSHARPTRVSDSPSSHRPAWCEAPRCRVTATSGCRSPGARPRAAACGKRA